MIEQLDPHDGRYTTIIEKVNELIDEVNSLRRDFEASVLNFDNHTHEYSVQRGGNTSGPLITMVDESRDRL